MSTSLGDPIQPPNRTFVKRQLRPFTSNRELLDLQKLTDDIGIEIRIAHYPPYCSKYNPIEHRLFHHVTRACQGVVFKSIDVVRDLIARTKTATGLAVTVDVLDKVYQTGRKASDAFRRAMPILFDDYLAQWNYRASPQTKLATLM